MEQSSTIIARTATETSERERALRERYRHHAARLDEPEHAVVWDVALERAMDAAEEGGAT